MDEIVLENGIPLEVDPAGVTTTVYNYMEGDDKLYVSSHGDTNKKWLRVEGGDYLKFATIVWLMQISNGQKVFPAYETI